MNSLNILSSRVIGQSIPGTARPRSRSQGETINSNQAEDYPRGRSFSAQNVAGLQSHFQPADTNHGLAGAAKQAGERDGETFTEKSPLLPQPSKSDVSLYKSKLYSLVKKIADALTALLTTIGAPVVYVVNCFKDSDGYYSLLLPVKRVVGPLFGWSPSTSSTATTVGLTTNASKKRSTEPEKTLEKRKIYTAKLRSSASNESLTSNTSESDSEKKKARPRSSEIRQQQPKAKTGQHLTARRSIRIQESKTESLDKRKQKRKATTGEEPLTVDTIKSPLSASQSLKIHKYPHTPRSTPTPDPATPTIILEPDRPRTQRPRSALPKDADSRPR